MAVKDVLKDKSLLFLIFTNIAIILLALVENWNVFKILFIYWSQSIIIGFFHVIKILTYNAGFNQKSDISGKIFASFFFIFHYGFFHLIYLFFLSFLSLGSILPSSGFFDDRYFVFTLILLFINHLFSFVYNKYIIKEEPKDFGKLFFQPYVRIIPMHLTIIFGSFFIIMNAPHVALVIFLLLKTVVDLLMHIKEHKK